MDSNVSLVSSTPAATLDDWIRWYEIVVFPMVGSVVFLLNILVAVNVRRLSFSPSTKAFVLAQSVNNLGGIACNSFYIPSVLVPMAYDDDPSSFAYRIPGFFAVFDIYVAMGLLLMMAIQRAVYIFKTMSAEVFYK